MKRKMKLTVSVLLAVLLCLPIGALTLTQPEQAMELVTAETTEDGFTLTASGSVQPGINILTGTSAPYSFSGVTLDNAKQKFNIDANWSLAANPCKTGSNAAATQVLQTTAGNFHAISTKDFSPIEPERPIAISYDWYGHISTFIAFNVKAAANGTGEFAVDANSRWFTVKKTLTPKDYSAVTGSVKNVHIGTWANSSKTPCLDNISVIPAYKITYLNENDEVIATDYAVTDASGNLLTAYTPNKSLIPNASEVDKVSTVKGGADMASVPLNNEDITLYVSYKEGWKPGLNLLTGTAAPYGFSGRTLAEIQQVLNIGPYSLAENPCNTGSNGSATQVLQTTSENFKAVSTKVAFSPAIELERPIAISYDWYGGGSGVIQFNVGALMGSGSYGINNFGTVANDNSSSATKWVTIHKMLTPKDYTNLTGDVTKVHIGVWSQGKTPCLDNISIVPAYKITYLNENDEVIATDYAVTDASGKLLTSYTPDKSVIPNGGAIAAISTEKGGANVDSVALGNADLTLYVSYYDLAPANTNEYSIRLGTIRGMRMTSFLTVSQREIVDEYGFIVAVADDFGGDYSMLVFPDYLKGKTALAEGVTAKGTLANGASFVYATSYAKAADGTVTTDIHKLGAFGDVDGFFFNAVLINIPAEKYAAKFVVRPYVCVRGSYLYGEAMVKSIQDVAKVLYADDDYIASLSDEDFEFISAIVESVEA